MTQMTRTRTQLAVDGGEDVTFTSAIIATGSSPLRPPIAGLESGRCVDSEGLLAQTEVPRRLVILGEASLDVSSRRSSRGSAAR